MKIQNIIIRAAQLAAYHHNGQFRKWTNRPYIEHPARVAGRVVLLPGCTEDMVAAAWLHDVLEDTECRAQEIENACNTEVFRLVTLLTNPSNGSTAPRADRKQVDRLHLQACPRHVQAIKLADRADNLTDIGLADFRFRMLYCRESLDLIEAIGQAWPAVADEIREQCEPAQAVV